MAESLCAADFVICDVSILVVCVVVILGTIFSADVDL